MDGNRYWGGLQETSGVLTVADKTIGKNTKEGEGRERGLSYREKEAHLVETRQVKNGERSV